MTLSHNYYTIDEEDLIKRVDEFIIWYNTDRPQDKLKGMTPHEFRDSFQTIN